MSFYNSKNTYILIFLFDHFEWINQACRKYVMVANNFDNIPRNLDKLLSDFLIEVPKI